MNVDHRQSVAGKRNKRLRILALSVVFMTRLWFVSGCDGLNCRKSVDGPEVASDGLSECRHELQPFAMNPATHCDEDHLANDTLGKLAIARFNALRADEPRSS